MIELNEVQIIVLMIVYGFLGTVWFVATIQKQNYLRGVKIPSFLWYNKSIKYRTTHNKQGGFCLCLQLVKVN